MNEEPQTDDAIGRSAMAKAMWRILPLILLACVVAYIDRVNVSFASLQMNEDLKFSATIYGLGGGLFFLGYALFEVPSSLMLARVRAPQSIAQIMITWGLLAAGMMFVHTPLQFYAYFAGWFPMACRGRAVSRIYVASSLASIVMGGISGSLLGLVVLAAGLLLLGVGSTPALVVEALVILYVRTRVMSERRVRAAPLAQPLAVSL